MQSISTVEALSDYEKGVSVIVDVREPAEFRDSSIPGAINLPSTQDHHEKFADFRDRKICLVCSSGSRAKEVARKLESAGFEKLFLLEPQMDRYQRPTESTSGWSVDRQFRLTLGLLLAIFLAGWSAGLSWLIAIPIILSTGLIFTSIIDRCYMRAGIAMLPWNRGKEN